MKKEMDMLNPQALDWLLEEDPINTPVAISGVAGSGWPV